MSIDQSGLLRLRIVSTTEKSIDVLLSATHTFAVRLISKPILLVLLSALSALAAQEPRLEIFTGYSYFNASALERHSYSGGQFNIKFNIHPMVAFVVDGGGQYRGDPSIKRGDFFFLNFHDRYLHAYQLLVGPEFTRRGTGSDLFFHPLAGMVHGVTDRNGHNFAALGVGGGFVFHRQRRVGLRVQLDYIPNRGGGSSYNDVRLGTGIVLRAKRGE